MKFYALFKKRFLIAPTVTQTETPNGSPAVQKGKKGKQRQDQLLEQGDENVERLLPKIFDDAYSKNWKDINSKIDTKIALEFLKLSCEHAASDEPEQLQVSYLLSV